jgi:hypothetical protein
VPRKLPYGNYLGAALEARILPSMYLTALALIASGKNYLARLERFARLLCGPIKRPLPRLRMATIERRLTEPRGSIRPFRLERIVRISFSKISQSLICEINVAGVDILLASR